jgi:hypothetical protein
MEYELDFAKLKKMNNCQDHKQWILEKNIKGP